jgi:hypothetical protein
MSERYAMLALRKESIEDVARAINEPSRRVCETLALTKPNFRIRHKIAEHLGLSYERCWGETEPTPGQTTPTHLRLATPPDESKNTNEADETHQ